MSTKADRLPMSRTNLVLGIVFVAGIAATLALRLWVQAAFLGLVLVFGALSVYWARRPNSSDLNRVDAIEYRDERDRAIARDGFALVGAVALALSLVEYVVMSALLPEGFVLPLLQTTFLCAVWAFGNRAAARRR